MSDSRLFLPAALGRLLLTNRLVMAPMTRGRASSPGDVPNALMAEYYAQRSGAGLILTEAVAISPQGRGGSGTPGLYTASQVSGWRVVTEAVHEAGGRVFAQLWHAGRLSHPRLQPDGLPVAPSAVAPNARVWVVDEQGEGRRLDCPVPHALSLSQISVIVDDFRRAACHAMLAGFDGVEIHGGNGHLIDQFLRTTANRRSDRYGLRRTSFAAEVIEGVCAEIGADRVGLRLSPFLSQRSEPCPVIVATTLELAAFCEKAKLLYLHLAEADGGEAPTIPAYFRRALRHAFLGKVIVAGRYTMARAEEALSAGWADFIAVGRPFIANPDLPQRWRHALPLAELDNETLLGGGARGYTDYPTHPDLPPAR